VVAPRPLVQVALEPLVRDGVMRATDARLEQAEEAVDGLGMHVPVHVDAGLVLDPPMDAALLAEPLIRLVFVGEDYRTGEHVFMRQRQDGRGPTIGNDLGSDTPAPVDRRGQDGLALPVVGLRSPAKSLPSRAAGLARR